MPWLTESSSSGFESISETETTENRNFSICSALSPTRIKEKVPKKRSDSSQDNFGQTKFGRSESLPDNFGQTDRSKMNEQGIQNTTIF
jgi:hypothetical protein